MTTEAQIKAESYWKREQVSAELSAFGVRLRNHFGRPASAFGTVGNTAHLVGRHRSLEWNLSSKFAERRDYGTTDRRDTRGNHRLIRAFDFATPAATHHAISRRLDAACRDGRAYMLAEYYGDLGDDSKVDGWFEGHDSTSDSSHRSHVHGGLWTMYADNASALSDLFDIMTGDDMSWSEDVIPVSGDPKNPKWVASTALGYVVDKVRKTSLDTDAIRESLTVSATREQGLVIAVQALADQLAAGGGDPDSAAIIARVNEFGVTLGSRIAALEAALEAADVERERLMEALADALSA